MRIRKHSGTLFAPLERPKRSTSCIAISNGHGLNGGDERFLLPLVAAVMDVQQAEDKEGGGDHGTHTRPTPNWRNALHQQSCSEGNSKRQDLQNGAEGRQPDWRWNRSVRSQCDNNIGLFTKQETHGAFLVNEDPGAEKETTRGGDEEWKLPKNLSVRSVKRKRSKNEIGYFKGLKDDESKTSKRPRQESYIDQEDGRKVDDKTTPNKRYNNNNETEGSQCRRRNGRGWRCSQRTLVGYSLCEHHLGKGRFRSININSNASTVTVNTKAGTCKLKELHLINASS